jgi:transposase
LFEAFAVMVMEQVPSLTKAAAILGISWKEAHTLRKYAVARGLERRTVDQIDFLGIDEKSFGRKERFITVLTDLAGERVLEVAPSKSIEAAKVVLAVIPQQARQLVEAVAMDMSAAMEKACREELPNADIVYEKMLKSHLGNILTYLRYGITNAFTEGMNSRIQEIKSTAREFRNIDNYRIAILLSCGILDMRQSCPATK